MRIEWLAALALLAACAVPPTVAGAPCPCPSGYHCDEQRNVCAPGEPPPLLAPKCAQIGAAPPVAIGPTEYRFSVADLLGVELAPHEVPVEEEGGTAFVTSDPQRALKLEGLRGLAPMVAARARLTPPPACVANAPPSDACARAVVDGLAARAFRRPLDDAERAPLLAAFDAARGEGLGPATTAAATAVLASDRFLYRRDVVGAPIPDSTLARLDAYALAGRLAFLLWRSLPDQPLLAAAASGALLGADERVRQVTRMRADPRAARMLTAFFRDWLDVSEERLGQDASLAPELRTAILRSFDGSAELVHAADAPLATLQAPPTLLANRAMATFYGLPAPSGDGFGSVTPPAEQPRRGLVTAPALLATLGHGAESLPVSRGRHLLERLLCAPLPAAPPQTPPRPPADGSTARERYAAHRQMATCASCHGLLDPIGLGLENFDGVGRWRLREGDRAIEPQGQVPAAGDLPGFGWSGPAELAQKLGELPAARACFVRQWFRYSFGRPETPADACTLSELERAFAAGGDRVGALLGALAGSDAFTALPPPPAK